MLQCIFTGSKQDLVVCVNLFLSTVRLLKNNQPIEMPISFVEIDLYTLIYK